MARYCSPSYALRQFSLGPLAGQIIAPIEFLIAQGLLRQGYALSIPDHQGPKSAYSAGPLAGRIALDGIRASQQFTELGVTTNSPIAMYGYSGGAIATGHAAELASSYAPELNIVGAAEGGVPADLGAVLANGDRQLFAGEIMAAIIGVAREYPYFQQYLDRYLNPLGKTLIAIKNPLCVQYQAAVLPCLNLQGMLTYPGNPLDAPPVRRLVADTRLGKTTPRFPLFVWNSNPDELIPVGQTTRLVNTYCQDPTARVRYIRDHFSEHITAEVSGAPQALVWITDRISGTPTAPGCHVSDQGSMLLDPAAQRKFEAIVDADLAALFGKALGRER